MKTQTKKGFTVVELVIVVAVIAVLAAVLIPTFSGIIKKANLNADKQAVREMNEALAQYEASTGYTALADVESVMQVLANAGYNTNNWQCLTTGYEVYWYQKDNRMILYNASEAAIEYPEEYIGTKVMVTAENKFFLYNNNQVEAQKFDLGFSSIDASSVSAKSSLSSAVTVADSNTSLTSVAAQNITAIENATDSSTTISNAIKSSAGGNSSSTLTYYATREVKSGETNAYVSMQVAAVGTVGNPVVLTNSGEVAENLYYINVVTNNNATAAEIKSAQQAAAKMIYTVFSQMTTGKVVEDATIILAPGTTLDCSANEWAPCKKFTGYFGTSDASNPVVVDGARLTEATGFASTVAFNGSSSKYFVTGFFGTVYGETTIENVTFKNISISSPASDYQLTNADVTNGKVNTRNTVGIIGGITDGYENVKNGVAANITIKNVLVESSCSITGAGCCGGLVGYIGSANSAAKGDGKTGYDLTGTINIENCNVKCNVTSTDSKSDAGYKSVGGIVGFTCRTTVALNIKNCQYSGTATSQGNTGAVIGSVAGSSHQISINGGTYNTCKLNGNVVSSVIGYCKGATELITMTGTPALASGYEHTYNSSSTANPCVISETGIAAK